MIFFERNIFYKSLNITILRKNNHFMFVLQSNSIYRVSINDCRVQPAMESCQILNVPLCSAINECHIFRLGCWLLTRDKFQLCFTLANINVFII
jgi:hypothetical protein